MSGCVRWPRGWVPTRAVSAPTLAIASRLEPLAVHPCQLNGEIEKGEEAIAELKVETEKYRGQDKGAASHAALSKRIAWGACSDTPRAGDKPWAAPSGRAPGRTHWAPLAPGPCLLNGFKRLLHY